MEGYDTFYMFHCSLFNKAWKTTSLKSLPECTIASVAAVVNHSTVLAEFLGSIKSIFHQT